jgi:hypothetical protein
MRVRIPSRTAALDGGLTSSGGTYEQRRAGYWVS